MIISDRNNGQNVKIRPWLSYYIHKGSVSAELIYSYVYIHPHTQKQINWANDIHMAHTRCWRCYALMAEEHKGLFEAVTLILAARGSCGSGALKPLLAICWGHQKQVNQHLHQHRTGIKSQQSYSNAHNTCCLTYIHLHISPEVHFSPKLSRSHSKAKSTLKEVLHILI